MKYRRFGTTKRDVSVIGQGTWYLDTSDSNAAVAALECGLDLGMNHIDTAELYGMGAVETLVGGAIAGRRDEAFLVSKVMPQHASRPAIIHACEKSLKQLGTDRLDCYLLHWRGPRPLEETIAGFEMLRRAGKILSWGMSNFDVDDLEEAIAVAGPGRIACNQILYHLQERNAEHAIIPWCERNGVAVTAYSPFGHGNFPTPQSRGGRVLADIARTHAATPHQVVLAFLTRWPVVFAIPKASRPEHCEENAKAASLQLTQADIDQIETAFPLGARLRALPVL